MVSSIISFIYLLFLDYVHMPACMHAINACNGSSTCSLMHANATIHVCSSSRALSCLRLCIVVGAPLFVHPCINPFCSFHLLICHYLLTFIHCTCVLCSSLLLRFWCDWWRFMVVLLYHVCSFWLCIGFVCGVYTHITWFRSARWVCFPRIL